MDVLKVYEHKHPLTLVNLQLHYEEEEEEEEGDDDEEEEEGDDDEEEEDGFEGATCGRCREEIHMYHRFYYKCMADSSCDFSLHKFCGELPSRLDHHSHLPHTLHLGPYSYLSSYLFSYSSSDSYYDRICKICKRDCNPGEHCYKCYQCHFSIHVKCGMEVGKNVIHHPSHPHLLMCSIPKPILCECSACGKEHKGMFYQCTTCVGFTIHSECAFLPEKLFIQERTDGAFHHTHPLTISYSFPLIDQQAKHWPRCRVCSRSFSNPNHWIYECDKCMYYAHVNCATSRTEPFMSILLPPGKIVKNFEDADHPHLLPLPFPDETYSVPKHLFSQEIGSGTIGIDKVNLKHVSHKHPLILVQTQSNDKIGQSSSKIDSWLLMCHDPMKKTQLLCNGCLRPIMSTMPFYKCPHQSCNDFALHEWCTRLPSEIQNHPTHPHHTLRLMYTMTPRCFFGVFYCDVCHLPCNGFAYCCVKCGYLVDVTCGFIPKEITHKAHPDHILSIVWTGSPDVPCHMCLQRLTWDPRSYPDYQFYSTTYQPSFGCKVCDIYVHPECALLLPETITHKHDKHPMHLSYLPIQDHKSEYFCEICEEDLNPHASFYHCQGCVQSIHTACSPLILKCETDTYTSHMRGIHQFVNVKFGGIYYPGGHPHPLSFAQGIASDGQCSSCHNGLQYKMIFKCLQCKFAIDYRCGHLDHLKLVGSPLRF